MQITEFAGIHEKRKQSVLKNSEKNPIGIFIDILCECGKRLLLIVCRKDKLIEHLHRKEVANFLFKYGYNPDNELSGYFEILKSRINCDDFPH